MLGPRSLIALSMWLEKPSPFGRRISSPRSTHWTLLPRMSRLTGWPRTSASMVTSAVNAMAGVGQPPTASKLTHSGIQGMEVASVIRNLNRLGGAFAIRTKPQLKKTRHRTQGLHSRVQRVASSSHRSLSDFGIPLTAGIIGEPWPVAIFRDED